MKYGKKVKKLEMIKKRRGVCNEKNAKSKTSYKSKVTWLIALQCLEVELEHF